MKNTPGNHANKFAAEHPAFKGLLTVITLTPAGRFGRRGLRRKHLDFWVTDGKAAMIRGSHKGKVFNGQCQVCGKIFLKMELQYGFAPDPNAGQVVEEQTQQYLFTHGLVLRREGWTLVYADWAMVNACAPCIAEHSLMVRDWSLQHSDTSKKIYYHDRRHPTLSFRGTTDKHTLDIREFYNT